MTAGPAEDGSPHPKPTTLKRAAGRRPATPPSYSDRLLAELEEIGGAYNEVIRLSSIENIDPNRYASSVIFANRPSWGWAASGPALEASRMALLRRVRDWADRFRLLFTNPIPTVTTRLDVHLRWLEGWLVRGSRRDHSVPSTIDHALELLRKDIDGLRELAALLPADEHPVRLVVDTNSLIDNPDLGAYTAVLGPRYVVHVLPVVLREVDELKRAGRHQELREAARRVERRLKGLRDNGDVRSGARVAGEVSAVFGHVEPRGEGLPSWLDLSVPDDQLVASTLLLQSDHPGSAVYVATSDLNLQTKLAAIGLPYVEVPDPQGGQG